MPPVPSLNIFAVLLLDQTGLLFCLCLERPLHILVWFPPHSKILWEKSVELIFIKISTDADTMNELLHSGPSTVLSRW